MLKSSFFLSPPGRGSPPELQGGLEALPLSSEALPYGSEALHASFEALPSSSEGCEPDFPPWVFICSKMLIYLVFDIT